MKLATTSLAISALALSALALATLPALAQTPAAQNPAKRPMTFADLQAMKRISDPQVSPGGKWVLFSVTDVSIEKNSKTNHLWIVPITGSTPAIPERQLTAGSGESNGRFSPDGKLVSYTAEAVSTGSPSTSQIYVASFNEATGTLGTARTVTALATEADGAIWAPDSRHLLFTSAVYPACQSFAAAGPERDNAEALCNSAKLAAEDGSKVKAELFTSLLYRHWNAYTGERRSHIFYAALPSAGAQPEAPTDLTPASVIGDAQAPTFSLGGPLGYAISPDGKQVAYEVNLEGAHVALYQPGLTDTQRKTLAFQPQPYPQAAESTNNDIFTLEPTADPATAKKVSTSKGSDDGPQYSPDGKYLAWRSQARNGYESDKIDLAVMDRATGNIRNLTKNFDGWVDEFTWNLANPVLYFTSAFHGEERVYVTSFYGEQNGPASLEARGGEFGSLTPLRSSSGSSSQLLATRMKVDEPTMLVGITMHDVAKGILIDRTGKVTYPEGDNRVVSETVSEQETLTHLNDALLAQLDLPKMESFTFPGANGTPVQGFLIRPPNFDPAKKYPVKFLIHGGPQGAWSDAWSYRWNPELFAASGYVVVMVNPRGSTGYGQNFLEQVSGDWGGRAYTDLMKGMDYAEQHYPFIDKSRECALGASYGGFMADWVLTHTDRFAAIVTHDGMSDPQAAFGDTEELWFNEWEFRPLQGRGDQGSGGTGSHSRSPLLSSRSEAKGSASPSSSSRNASSSHLSSLAAGRGSASPADAVVEQSTPSHPWDFYDKPASEDPYRKWSPMHFIRSAKTPTLVVHSQRDYRLDVSQGFELFTALQLLKVPSEMLYFPDEGHWVLKPQNSELWYRTVNDWCDRWTHTNAYAAPK